MDDINQEQENRMINRIEEIYRINTFINDRTYYYHYSNYDNLEKIITKFGYKFKMTDYVNFADKYEGKLIIDLYKEVIKDLYDKDCIEIQLYNSLFNLNLKDEGIVKISRKYFDYDKYHLFVTCFCNKINDNYMWSNYGNGSSKNKICIIVPSYLFNTQFMYIEKITSSKMYDSSYKLQKVIYDRNKQKELLSSAILKHIDFYKNDKEYDRLNYLRFNIIEDLKYYQLMFKEEKYHKEKELRVIYKLCDTVYKKYKNEENENSIYLRLLTNELKPVIFLHVTDLSKDENILTIKNDEIKNFDY